MFIFTKTPESTIQKKIEAIQNIFDMGLQLIVLASFQYNSNTTVISIIILP